jgi:peptide/nickel transport system substrate-binding protein
MTQFRRSQTRRRLQVLAIPIVAALLAASCGGGDDDATPADDSTPADDVVVDDGSDAATTDAPSTPDETSATTDDDASDGSPVVETLPPTAENEDPVFGGTLRFGLEAETSGLNPSTSALAASGWTMINAVFDTLTADTADGGVVPYLAESYTPNEDFTQWTVKVRDGITFHDGEPLNADALIANFEAQRLSTLVGLAIVPFYEAPTKVDEMTVRFNLLDADSQFPTTGSTQLGVIASPKWLAAAAADPSLNQRPVGTGPFMFESRTEDSVTRVVRNPNWWGGEVYLDAIEFYPVNDGASRVDLLFGGELDGLHTTDQGSIIDLRADDSIQNLLDDSGEESYVMLNSAAPPFDDVRAREALARATPRQNYIDLIGLGENRGADQRYIPESPYYNPDVKQVADDPDGAVALAAEYCAERGTEENPVLGGPTCTDGKINIELQWSGPSIVDTRIADLLDAGWGVAFNVVFDEILQDEHILQTAIGQYNSLTWRQFGAVNPLNDNVFVMCRTIGGISLSWPRYCDEDREAALLTAWASDDEAERTALLQDIERMINEAYTYVFLIHTMWDNAFADNVHGVCDRKGPDGDPLACAINGHNWFSSIWIDEA